MVLTFFFIITKCIGVLNMSWYWIILMIFVDGIYAQSCKQYYIEKFINGMEKNK